MLVGVRMLVTANLLAHALPLHGCLRHCIVTRQQSFKVFDVFGLPTHTIFATRSQSTQCAACRVHAPRAIRLQCGVCAPQCCGWMYHIIADTCAIKNVGHCHRLPLSHSITAVVAAASARSVCTSSGAVGGELYSISRFTGIPFTFAMHILFGSRFLNAQTIRML